MQKKLEESFCVTNTRDIDVVNYENGWNDAINFTQKIMRGG